MKIAQSADFRELVVTRNLVHEKAWKRLLEKQRSERLRGNRSDWSIRFDIRTWSLGQLAVFRGKWMRCHVDSSPSVLWTRKVAAREARALLFNLVGGEGFAMAILREQMV